jgi:ABC-2 type transport system ATP-binding protein
LNVIETEHLGKTYAEGTNALHGLSMAISPGEIFGFLGPNGSGKTTTVRLLNGVLEPSQGKAALFGMPVAGHSSEIRARCGVLTETAAPYELMSAAENLEFFGDLNNLTPALMKERSSFLLEYFQLSAAADKKVRTFSTGMKKRLCLAITLLHRPAMLFLDEPTSGLDPEAARQVNRLIRKVAQEEGVTVFLCTHQLKYAEEICTLYGFIHGGHLVAFGRKPELLAQTQNSRHLIIRGEGIPDEPDWEKTGEKTYRKGISGDEEAGTLVTSLIQKGARLFEARQEEAGLEDLYFAFQEKVRREQSDLGNHPQRS